MTKAIDRTGWGAGPWDGEPDREEWEVRNVPKNSLKLRGTAKCRLIMNDEKEPRPSEPLITNEVASSGQAARPEGGQSEIRTGSGNTAHQSAVSPPSARAKGLQMKAIPISAAKQIAEKYGYDQVIVVARAVGTGEHVTTYGKDKANCEVAARIGNFLKYEIMGWAALPSPIDQRETYDLAEPERKENE